MKKTVLTIITLSILICLLAATGVYASSGGPGSNADPLVSQKYVDDKYEKLLEEFTELLAGFKGSSTVQLTDSQFDMVIEDVIKALDNREQTGQQSADNTYTPVYAYAGQVITGGEGTEIILRSGTAVAWVYGQNGLSDVTAGVDILGNEPIRQNHLLIVPRSDGRGVKASTDCWFLVKGTYTMTR